MVLNDELASALQLSEANPSDEVKGIVCAQMNPTDIYGIIYYPQDISLAFVALLTSATRDAEPKMSLSEIYRLITRSGATSLLVRNLGFIMISTNARADQTDVLGPIEHASSSTSMQ